MSPVRSSGGAARIIENLVDRACGAPLPVAVRAWDGSTAGPEEGPRVVLRRAALRHLLWSPGELGLARAFVAGDLHVDGDLTDGLRRCWAWLRQHDVRGLPGPREWPALGVGAVRLGAFGPRPPIPDSEARLSGDRHSRGRDRSAIAHHYDLGNAFYQLLLDPSMAYSCGYFRDGGETLERAQVAKLELICAKLGLEPGMRLLDVGCGWGSLLLHAAQHHDVRATGITLSRQQYEHVWSRVEQLGLRDRVRVHQADYREFADEPYDAVASVEMGEHVGQRHYPEYVAALWRMLRPRGRLLLQQMSRGAVAPGGGAFISSYIAPDMTMVPIGRTLERLRAVGFEVRDVEALREHYVRTVDAWARTLERRGAEVVGLIGEQGYRVWRLYLAGGLLAFEENRMGVDQILAVRPTPTGASGMPTVLREARA